MSFPLSVFIKYLFHIGYMRVLPKVYGKVELNDNFDAKMLKSMKVFHNTCFSRTFSRPFLKLCIKYNSKPMKHRWKYYPQPLLANPSAVSWCRGWGHILLLVSVGKKNGGVLPQPLLTLAVLFKRGFLPQGTLAKVRFFWSWEPFVEMSSFLYRRLSIYMTWNCILYL